MPRVDFHFAQHPTDIAVPHIGKCSDLTVKEFVLPLMTSSRSRTDSGIFSAGRLPRWCTALGRSGSRTFHVLMLAQMFIPACGSSIQLSKLALCFSLFLSVAFSGQSRTVTGVMNFRFALNEPR